MRISASERVALWLRGLPPDTRRRVRAALRSLAGAGRELDVKALRRELEGFYRLRVGDHRIVYHVESRHSICLDYVDLREVVYEAFRRLRALREWPEPAAPGVRARAGMKRPRRHS